MHMETKIFRSKVDWWVYAIVPFAILCCMIGPILTKSDYWIGILLSILFSILIICVFASTKYAVRGNEFGVKCGFGWKWFPIDKIERVAPIKSILAAPALSTHRIAIRFADRKILKSSAPLEISPKDQEKFITELRSINPDIRLS